MEYIKLNNGVDIPILGYGTFQIPLSIAEECVLNALNVGYRMSDTSAAYFNEKEIGKMCIRDRVYGLVKMVKAFLFLLVQLLAVMFIML